MSQKKITLIFTIILFLIFAIFMIHRYFFDVNFQEARCYQNSLEKIKTYRLETGKDPEEVVADMFYQDCMRDSGWLK